MPRLSLALKGEGLKEGGGDTKRRGGGGGKKVENEEKWEGSEGKG